MKEKDQNLDHSLMPVRVYVEAGHSRTFAAALDWPGWCRSGRDETSALQALIDYGPRYARVLKDTPVVFQAPTVTVDLLVVERLPGNATTDFGAPNLAVSTDTRPVEAAELERWQTLLKACWKAFDAAAHSAEGKDLRKGPRGGGRDLMKIIEHVRNVDKAYLASLGGKIKPYLAGEPGQELAAIRQSILTTLTSAAQGEISGRRPRGGLLWTARYFVRRLAWHELDHAWEMEDRVE